MQVHTGRARRGRGERRRVTVGAGDFEVRPVGEVEHLAEHVQVPRPERDPVTEAHVGLEEAARSLGAGPWAVQRDVVLPALAPAFVASGAIAFATAMGAFGTAFTLATNIDVLPMLIYTEFTLAANFATSAALSVGLGIIAWAILALARSFSGSTVAAAG